MSTAIQQQLSMTPAQRALWQRAQGLLTPNERVLAIAAQTDTVRWFVLPPDGVIVTDHRILFLKLGWFSFQFRDLHWEHVQDVHVTGQMFGSTVSATGAASKSGYATHAIQQGSVSYSVSGLDKGQAQEVYRLGQQMEAEWREKVRTRIMQERQVERGAVVIQGGQGGGWPQQAQVGADDVAARIQKLKSLLDQGLISQAEFDKRKAEILQSV